MALLSKNDNERIASAVSKAERNTGGEIVTAVIGESDDYAFHELLFAITVGFMAFIVLAAFNGPLSRLLDGVFWARSAGLLILATGLAGLLVGAAAYALAQIPAIDRFIVPKKVMAESVRRRAQRHFMDSGAADTIDRTGIVLFLSLLERRVELIADKGINEKVSPDTWDRIVSALVRGIQEGRAAIALEEAILDIGEILAQHVPPRDDDTNELANGPSELEKGS